MKFFYLQRSDRISILLLLIVIGTALLTFWIVGGQDDADTALRSDTTTQDSSYRQRRKTVYRHPWKNDRPTERYIYRYRDRPKRRRPYNRRDSDFYSPQRVLPHLRDTTVFPRKISKGERIDLNHADTTTLRSVPGIGPYFAAQIVRHGQYLGGYVSVDQLDEITDFPREAKQYFEIRNPQPRRININKLTLQQLRRHPYINYYQARCIVDYRRLHGRISSLQDLSLSRDFPPEAIQRLEPYVEY